MGKRIWTSQPQYPTELDKSNPLLRGLIAAYDQNGIELLTGTPPTSITAPPTSTSFGMGRLFAGGSEVMQGKELLVTVNNYTTITFFRADFASTSGVRQGIFDTQVAGAAGNRLRLIWLDATSGFYIDTNGGYAYTAKPTFASGDQLAIAFTKGTGTLTGALYANGVALATTQAAFSTDTGVPTTAAPMYLGDDVEFTSGKRLNGAMLLHLHFSRVLSASEIRSVSANPWQIFAPQRRNNYIGVTSATTHGCTGVLAGAGATIAGVAEHKVKHSSSGALAGAGATIAGVAVRKAKHICTAVIAGIGAEVAGVANRVGGATTHSSSGALGGTGATVAGVAQHYPKHVCTGALAGAGATVAGVARHVAHHVASGVLAGAGAVIVGAASRPYVENLLLTPLEADGDLVNNEWLARQLRALGGNIQTNVGAMPDFNSANQQIVSVGKTPAEVKGAVLNKESTYKKLK